MTTTNFDFHHPVEEYRRMLFPSQTIDELSDTEFRFLMSIVDDGIATCPNCDNKLGAERFQIGPNPFDQPNQYDPDKRFGTASGIVDEGKVWCPECLTYLCHPDHDPDVIVEATLRLIETSASNVMSDEDVQLQKQRAARIRQLLFGAEDEQT